MKEHIIWAFSFDEVGVATPINEAEVAKAVEAEYLTWVHLDGNDPNTKAWLEQETSYLDPFITEALMVDETRPRVTEIDDGAIIILRGVNLNADEDPEDMVSVRLWVDSYRIISIQRRGVKALSEIVDKFKSVNFKGGPKSSGDFMAMLVSKLFEHMEPVLASLDEDTYEIEGLVIENPDYSLRESIVEIRKRSIMFRRYMTPQREAISHLYASELSWLDSVNIRQLQENYNRVTRYVEDLDTIRERCQIVRDELANVLSDRLNKNMYILSVIASIFLPLTFITGLFGMNISGVPGYYNQNAFTIITLALGVVMTLQIIIFKKLRWF